MDKKINTPHDFNNVNLGHAHGYCRYCGGTPNEISVIGDLNHCPERKNANDKEGAEGDGE